MIEKLLKNSIREYRKPALLTSLFVVLEVIMDVIIPLVIGKIINLVQNQAELTEIYKLGALLVGLSILTFVFGYLNGRYAAFAASGFGKNLRNDMFNATQDYSFSNIDHFSTSSIVNRMTSDVTRVEMAYQMSIRIAIRAPLMLLGALIMAFIINVKISLIFLAAIPLLALGLFLITKYVRPLFIKVFKKLDNMNNVVQENVRGIRTVKSYVREEHEIEKFTGSTTEIKDGFSKIEKILALNTPMLLGFVYAITLLISWFGAKLIIEVGAGPGGMEIGDLTALLNYSMQILMSLNMLSMIFVITIISRASQKRIVELLVEEQDLKNPEDPIYEVLNGDVEFVNVDFSYTSKPDACCLNNANLKILSGETVGIIGGTGSSKSTLVQLIPRLYDATAGSVKVGGVDVKDYDVETLRESVGMVLQKNVLFSGTIKENLLWGNPNATDEEIIHAAKLAQADNFIQSFPLKYETYLEQGGSNVSGGQKQRICIARALLKKPQILILDDSTSAVDTKTDSAIRTAMYEEIPHTTKIIIAQRISSIQNADKVIVMDEGGINAFDTPENLLKNNEIYQDVYHSQLKGGGFNE